MFVELSAPVTVQWELTGWCNHNCIYCYNYWKDERLPLTVTDETLDLFEKVADEIISNKISHVTLTGGEPLAVIEKAVPALMKLREAGIDLGINTNLTLLTPQKAAILRQLGIRSILTSLQSSNPEITDFLTQKEGAFHRILRGIEIARKEGFSVTVNMVVTKLNLHLLKETARLSKQVGANAFCATKATPPFVDFSKYELDPEEFSQMLRDLVWVKKNLGLHVETLEHYPECAFPDEETRDILGGRSCSAGKTTCTIGFDGDIRPCSHAHMSYGHIKRGLKEAWRNMSEWRNDSLIPDTCKSCSAFPYGCWGGCRILAFVHKGDLKAIDPFCCVYPPPHFPLKGKSKEIVSSDAVVRMFKKIKWREEPFGYIVYSTAHKWLPIDKTLMRLLIASQSNGGLTAEMIAREYNVEESEAIDTLSLLVSKRIVEIVG